MNNAQTVPSPATVAANAARHRLADGQLARRAGSSREALAAYVAVKRVAQG